MTNFFKLRKYLSILIYKIDMLFGLNNNSFNVLCFHAISSKNDRYAVTAKKFRQIIKKLNNDSTFATIQDLQDKINGKLQSDKKFVFITFDDGYKNVLKIVDVIEKFKIKPILFITSDTKKINRQELENDHDLLNVADVNKLVKKGWIIGNHSATHSDFYKIKGEDIKLEILVSKKDLERKLNNKIKLFAYPKGRYTKDILKSIKRGGYDFAFTINQGSINSKTNRYLIPRTIVDNSHSIDEIPAIYSFSWHKLREITNKFNLWEKFLK